MTDARITIVCGTFMINGRDATKEEIAHIEAMVKSHALIRLEHGGVVWFEKNIHAIKTPPKTKPPKDHNRVETRGRKRGPNYGKHIKNPGVGKGGNYRKDIPLNLVKELKLCGLSGAEVARELARRGYGKVSKDFANRKLREAGVLIDSQQLGGRPRRGEQK